MWATQYFICIRGHVHCNFTILYGIKTRRLLPDVPAIKASNLHNTENCFCSVTGVQIVPGSFVYRQQHRIVLVHLLAGPGGDKQT